MSLDDGLDRVDQAKAGDRRALERLLLDSYHALVQHLRGQIPASMQAVIGVDDLIQQTFLQAFRDIERFESRGESSFLAWLKTIAGNRARDAIRAEQRQKRGGDRRRFYALAEGQTPQVDDLVEAYVATSDAASRIVARQEAIQAIQLAVAGLPDDQREAISKCYLEGLTVDQTAAAMGRTAGAVRGLLDRGKKKLHETLERASRYLSRK